MSFRSAATSRSLDIQPVLIVLGAVLLALVLGLLIGFFPWVFVLGLILLPIVALASIANPIIGLVFALALVFEVIPGGLQPRLPFGGGKLQIYDILFIYLAIVLLIRTLANRLQPLRTLGAFRWPLYYLAACVIFHWFTCASSRLIGWPLPKRSLLCLG